MLKAVIFDMDGVLIDSEPLHEKAGNLLLQELGVSLQKDDGDRFIGTTIRHMYEVLTEELKLEQSVDELLVRYHEKRRRLEEQEPYQMFDGMKELLSDLRCHGMKLAVASSSTPEEIRANLKLCGVDSFFEVLLSGSQVPRPKPAPDIFEAAAARLGVQPRECLVVEDSYYGVEAAKSAGMIAVGFDSPHSHGQDLSQADLVVEGFEEADYPLFANAYSRSRNEPLTIAITERLVIRELSVEDIREMYPIYHQPEVRQFTKGLEEDLEQELLKHKAYIEQVYHFYGYGLWGVFDKETGALIGRCGIEQKMVDGREEIALGYLLSRAYWGNGYATECVSAVVHYAFMHLQLKRIVAEIEESNVRSVSVAERIGMVREKEFRREGRSCYLYVLNQEI